MIPPKVAVSNFCWNPQGANSDSRFQSVSGIEEATLLGQPLWARGYCADTGGLDAEKIRKYVRYQERKEREAEQRGFDF